MSLNGDLTAGAWIVSYRIGGITSDAQLAGTISSSLTGDAVLFGPLASSFAANAILVPPPDFLGGGGIPSGGGPPGRISIWINGLNYTPHVIWSTASFTAKVNGAVGDALIQVLDRSHNLTFTFGQEVYLNIDGVIRWGGWIQRPQRTFSMSVVPDPALQPRTWTLECVDFNLIFDKRVIHDLAHPEKSWDYAPGTYDDTIINDLWNYLDMEGFTKDIDRVAPAVLDIAGSTGSTSVASGGYSFRDALTAITKITAAIFYCSPTKVITYLDSDKVNSAYTLTDRPYPSTTSLVFSDDFSRIVSPGLGGDWVHEWGSTGYASVDGSTAVMQAAHYEGFSNSSISVEDPDMSLQFDFWVQSAASQGVFWTSYYYGDFNRSWFDIYPTFDPVGSPYQMDVELGYRPTVDSNSNSTTLMVDESSWYTAKMEQYGGGLANGGSRLKIWKRETSEPSEWLLTTTSASPIDQTPWPVEFEMDGTDTDVGRVDNFLVWTATGIAYVPPVNAVDYREIRIREDCSSMVNDALVWGAGYGSENIVFSRHEDATSQEEHGLWQAGVFKNGVYKQATADAISEQWVEGSPSAHRGAKNPKRSVELVTQSAAFSAGDVVAVECSPFAYTDILPIRAIGITFPAPNDPRFALTMTWEVDSAWSMFDPWKPSKPKIPPCDGCDDETEDPPPEGTGTGTCDETICGITDTFTRTRTTGQGWGTSDSGLTWEGYWYSMYPSGYLEEVNGDYAVLRCPDLAFQKTYEIVGQWLNNSWGITSTLPNQTFAVTVRMRVAAQDLSSTGLWWTVLVFGYGAFVYERWGGSTRSIRIGPNGTHHNTYSVESDVTLTTGAWYNVRAESTSTTAKMKFWLDGSAEPDWFLETSWPAGLSTTSNDDGFYVDAFSVPSSYDQSALEINYDNLDISGINRCEEYHFDSFNRTVASGWGVSDAGYAWTDFYTGALPSGVDSNKAFATGNGTYAAVGSASAKGTGPWSNDFVMLAHLSFLGTPSVYGSWFDFQVQDPAGNGSALVRVAWLPASSYVEYFVRDSSGAVLVDMVRTNVVWASGTWYTLKWDSLNGVRLWADGDSEPTEWMSGTSVPITSYTRDFWAAINSDKNASVFLDYIDFDYAGKPCYQDCSGGGGTTLSPDWTVEWLDGVAEPSYAVGSGYLQTIVAAADDGDIRFTYPIFIPAYMPGTTVQNIEFSFRFASADPVNVGRIFATFAGMIVDLKIATASNVHLSYGLSNAYATFSFIEGELYTMWMRVGSDLSSVGIYIWQVSSPANDVDLDITGISGIVGTSFSWRVDNYLAPASKSFIVDLSAFDISSNCTHLVPHVIDDWDDRTVELTPAVGTDDGSIWGALSSGTGDVWRNGGQWNSGTPSDVWYGVENGVGRIRHTNDEPVWPYDVASVVTLSDGWSPYYPWYVTGAGVPDYLFTDVPFTFSIDFMSDDWHSYMEIELTASWESYDSIYLYVTGDFGSSYDNMWTFNNYPAGQGIDDRAITLTAGTWYTFKCQIIGTTASGKLWERGTTEPGWHGSATVAARPWTVWERSSFNIMLNTYGSPGSYTNFYFDNFIRWTEESGIIAGAAGSSITGITAIGVKACDELLPQSSPSGGIYPSGAEWRTVRASYVPGSTTLAVNGVYQFGKYTESDPGDGVITANFAISTSDIVTLCYLTNGALP